MYKTFITLLGLTGISLLFMSSSNGVATAQGVDRTGSPVGLSSRCEGCHGGAGYTVSITNRLKDTSGAIVTSYIAGNSYKYEVELTSTGASKYGIETVAILPANINAGTLSSGATNNKIKSLTIGGKSRRYAEHVSPSASGLFVMNWVAPVAGSGNVRFYAAGIGCNGNGSTSGDKPTLAPVLTITENTSASVKEEIPSQISVYPNPVSDFININPSFAGTVRIMICSLEGKMVLMQQVNFVPGFTTRIDAATLLNGTYLLSVIDQNGKALQTAKIIK